jgi:hypothetical protein
VGDAGGAAEGVDEGRPGDPDRDAGAAGDVGDPLGLQEGLVEDKVGADGGETLGEAPTGG